MSSNCLTRRSLYLLFPLAAFLAVAHPLRGLVCLTVGSEKGDAVDLRLRWVEERYFFRGINPFDVTWRSLPQASQKEVKADSAHPPERQSDLEYPDPAHPPWGYVMGCAYLWPSWPAVRWYYAGLNVLVVIGLSVGVYLAFRPWGRPMALLLALGVPAMHGVNLTLQVGQYGILVTGLLAGCLALLSCGREIPAGLLLGLALIKPTISAPFFLVLLCRRRFKACAAALGYCLAASLIAWAVLGTNPLELLRQLRVTAATYIHEGTFGPLQMLLAAGIEPGRGIQILAVGGIALLFTILTLRGERLSLVDAFALAAVVGRLWTYHRVYDDVMLLFLLLSLASRMARCRSSILATGALFLVCLSLWLPSRFLDTVPAQVLLNLIWISAAVVLITQPFPESIAPEGSPASLPSLGQGDLSDEPLSLHRA